MTPSWITSKAIDRLARNWQFMQLNDDERDIVRQMLTLFLAKVYDWNIIIIPAQLITLRDTFVSTCEESLLEAWIKAMKKNGAGRYTPTRVLEWTHKPKVESAILRARFDAISRLTKLGAPPSDLSNGELLGFVFDLKETIPSDLTVERLALHHPHLLVNVVGWQKMFN
jgi:hypothetical protein